MKSSTSIKPQQIQRAWHVIDVSNETLGRISSQIAKLLIGKHKSYFVPHQDTGDYVVVINASKVKVTGNKLTEKTYYRHSGYPGGLKTRSLGTQLEMDPRRVIEKAVRGMLPKTKLGERMFEKLFVYSDEKHPYGDKVQKVKGE